ncbi:hypothetical protein [Kaistia algarum]|uniref:hypothetical protein n=1 Tax=Kaistia algarum TaxID=2083279 RepID=UPI001056F3DF|nr:hypothetical protein [Kaistia algarum]MCX5512440.1 hypothetical protein [Kaistia algarum]
MARAVRKLASRDLARISTLHDLRELFEQRATMKFQRFDLTNYVQTDIAWGMLQLATGDREGSESRIAAFCHEHGIDPATPILVAAKEQALQHRDASPAPQQTLPKPGLIQGLLRRGHSIVAAIKDGSL